MDEKFSFENIEEFESHKAKIMVIGSGGAGNNTITTLTEKGIKGAFTLALNTDANHLKNSKAHRKMLIGKSLTKGLGAGGYPEIGKNATLENKEELRSIMKDVDLVFLTCGLGGGTGTGSLPVIAKFAKEQGSIVIAVVTLPFKLEGSRIVKSEDGLSLLRQICDTVIVIENQKLLEFAGDMPLKKAFDIADNLMSTMIKGISETISEPSLVNLDYADVRAVMRTGGVATIGVGEAEGEQRAEKCVSKALNHPLLEVDYTGAKGALIQIIGGENLKLNEINHIGETIQKNLDPEAQVIWGARIIPEYKDKIQVITVVTGVKSPYIIGPVLAEKSHKDTLGIEVLNKN